MQKVRTMARNTAWVISEILRRNGLWVVVALLATLGVIGSAIFASRGNVTAGDRVLPNIGLNLFTAFLVAGLIEIFSQIGEISRVGKDRRRLQQLFGFKGTGASVAIVLSKFDVDAEHILAKQTEGWETLKNNHGHLVAYDEELIGVAVQADIMAASDLISMFSVLGFEAPMVMWDDEAVEHYKNTSSPYHSFITIGIASNALAMLINREESQHRLFLLDFEPRKVASGPEVDLTDAENLAVWRLWLARWNDAKTTIVRRESDWKPYVDEKWGLISKVVIPGLGRNKCVFLLAGMHSGGTRRLGDFIAKNWKSILGWADNSRSERRVEGNCFAAMVDIPANPTEAIGTDKRVVVDFGTNHLDPELPGLRGGV